MEVVVSTSTHSGGQLPSPSDWWHLQAHKPPPVKGIFRLKASSEIPDCTAEYDCSAHCCKALISPTIWYLLTTWMSLGPWGLRSEWGRKSWCPKTARLGEVFQQPDFSLCAVGSLNSKACFLASFCTWASLSGPEYLWWRDQNSSHQLGSSSLSARHVRTQSLGLSNGSGVSGSSGGTRLVTTGIWCYDWGGRLVWSVRLLDCIFEFGNFLWVFTVDHSSLLSFLGLQFISKEYSLFYQC